MIYDFIVIGAGIAGVSAAFELADQSKVLVVESEPQPGYHSTGRSAALFTPNFGNELVRSINFLSESFFNSPPANLVNSPLLQPRGALSVAAPGFEAELDQLLLLSTINNPIVEIPVSEALQRVPFLRKERVSRAVIEEGVSDIDVAGLFQAYITGLKQRGGQLVTHEPVKALIHNNDYWTISTPNNTYQAKTIINAAGAWADEVGALAGAPPIGLVPKRRTVIVVEATAGYEVGDLPLVELANSGAYIKPDAGRLIASLGDATPTHAQDVQPEELDIAVLADHIERETLIPVSQVLHRWAGLRSFVQDESPVVGFDTIAPNFIWLAGQGGFGIMMSPTLARAAASIALSQAMPSDIAASGITCAELGVKRLS